MLLPDSATQKPPIRGWARRAGLWIAFGLLVALLSSAIVALRADTRAIPEVAAPFTDAGLLRWDSFGYSYTTRLPSDLYRQLSPNGALHEMTSEEAAPFQPLLPDVYWDARCSAGWPWKSFDATSCWPLDAMERMDQRQGTACC
jgi:hypothetical protein